MQPVSELISSMRSYASACKARVNTAMNSPEGARVGKGINSVGGALIPALIISAIEEAKVPEDKWDWERFGWFTTFYTAVIWAVQNCPKWLGGQTGGFALFNILDGVIENKEDLLDSDKRGPASLRVLAHGAAGALQGYAFELAKGGGLADNALSLLAYNQINTLENSIKDNWPALASGNPDAINDAQSSVIFNVISGHFREPFALLGGALWALNKPTVESITGNGPPSMDDFNVMDNFKAGYNGTYDYYKKVDMKYEELGVTSFGKKLVKYLDQIGDHTLGLNGLSGWALKPGEIENRLLSAEEAHNSNGTFVTVEFSPGYDQKPGVPGPTKEELNNIGSFGFSPFAIHTLTLENNVVLNDCAMKAMSDALFAIDEKMREEQKGSYMDFTRKYIQGDLHVAYGADSLGNRFIDISLYERDGTAGKMMRFKAEPGTKGEISKGKLLPEVKDVNKFVWLSSLSTVPRYGPRK